MRSMRTTRMRRAVRRVALALAVCAAVPGSVATAPPDGRQAELRGACYCRVQGALNCVGVLSKVACDKQCAEALCDEWFWMERLACWNWGYGG